MTAVLQNIIDGRPTASDGELLDLIDPSTGEVYGQAPISTAAEVDAAFAAASRAFPAWRDATPAQRQLALFRLADALAEHAEEFADLESRDTGKPRATLVSDEIEQSVDQLRFFAGAARELNGRAAAEYAEGFTSYVRREPIGVVAQVTPWNYPLNMAIWKIGPALAAGNTIVLKPSETTPSTTVRLAELAAGILPAGVFNVVLGDRTTGALLTEHPVPQLVAITGSVRAGQAVAESASKQLKRVHLELGGKAPAVIFADADLQRAARGIAEAAFFNAGQDCTAATRVLVHSSVHDEFVRTLVAHVEAEIRTGAPDSGAFYGPLNNPAQLERVAGFVERLPEHARVETGGRRQGETGCFFEPTVVTGVRQDDEVVQNEVFGPVLTVQPFETENEAVELANGVPYALAASTWTTEHATAMRMTRALDFGCVWVNAHIPFVSDMPHGGFKQSGYGKDLSVYGFEDYTRLKHVMSSLE
ncbi:gamma-aminobutyraldehyde dehydrogenase [Microbacterium sp. YJN-G]|uniref:gamma-aminobutyraldehyde dehydrogenase n=1 Tax=Microbacterium sp. YJN-G TaxID=2763257 RepID=UPI001877B904|nr:gamma-aminobutyraldehyde dehydrogenase [Microbacterium sp. YJN-G]